MVVLMAPKSAESKAALRDIHLAAATVALTDKRMVAQSVEQTAEQTAATMAH